MFNFFISKNKAISNCVRLAHESMIASINFLGKDYRLFITFLFDERNILYKSLKKSDIECADNIIYEINCRIDNGNFINFRVNDMNDFYQKLYTVGGMWSPESPNISSLHMFENSSKENELTDMFFLYSFFMNNPRLNIDLTNISNIKSENLVITSNIPWLYWNKDDNGNIKKCFL